VEYNKERQTKTFADGKTGFGEGSKGTKAEWVEPKTITISQLSFIFSFHE
jgi:hypothetical protein